MMEPNAVWALFLSFLAGMSTLLGAAVVLFTKRSVKLITVSLGFAAGTMLSVSLTELFPLSVEYAEPMWGRKMGSVFAVLFLLAGMLLSLLLDRLLPEPKLVGSEGKSGKNQKLMRTGLCTMLALGLHNFPEGMMTFVTGYEDTALGAVITLAIALHNIPEGISVAMPVWFSTGKRRTAIWYTFVSGAAEPIGALIACLVLRPFLTETVIGAMFALVAGIMVYIAIEELLPSSREYGCDRLAMLSSMVGICLMPLTVALR